ncbi:unnamed protein product [Calypogeia fissa]
MKWTAEADLVVGLAVGSGKRKLGVGLGIGRRKIIKNVGIDLGEHQLKRCCVFFLKNSTVSSLNWSLDMRNSVLLDRDKAMKRTNVFNLLLQMMPASHHPVVPSSPDHWAFLEEVDAPKWADLVKEAALMGTIGDDPWFHRCHMHHETSLARAESLVTVSDSSGSSIEIPIPRRESQPTSRRRAEKGGGGGQGTVSKLLKPALKATVAKACLGGGRQRISSGGSSARGRLSPRPRLSTSLTKSKTVKKVNIIPRSGGVLLQPQQLKKVGFDTRAAQSEPSSTVGTPTRSSPSEAKPNGSSLRRSEPLLNNVREAAAQKIMGRRGGGVVGGGVATDRRIPSRSIGGESDDISLKGFESPASVPLYPLPSPRGQGTERVSRKHSIAAKSSPSDMYLSSDASPRHSISSQESLVRALSAAATESARRKILADGRRAIKGRSTDSFEVPSASDSSQSEITPVQVDEPHLEITSFNADQIVEEEDNASATTGGVEWNDNNQPESTPVVVKKRRSLGPAKRVKLAEKVASSLSAKKKSSSKDSNDKKKKQSGAEKSEKSGDKHATHPILEKLRKSWGSALRVKQREDAEATLSDARSDTSGDNSAEFKDRSNVTTRKKWEQEKAEALKRAQQQGGAGAVSNPHSSETEALIRNIVTRERRAAIVQQQQQLPQPQHLQLITDAGVLLSPSRCFSATNSDTDSRKGDKKHDSIITEIKTNAAATGPNAVNAAKASLARIQANHQRSKSDFPLKFKKQYVHGDMGLSKSMCMQKSNKENVQLEVKVPSPPPTGFAWKRKPAVPTRKQLSPRSLGTTAAVNGARALPPPPPATRTTTSNSTSVHASARPPNPPSTTQTSSPARSLVTSGRSSLLGASATKTVSLDAADASTSKTRSETLDRKANLAVLRGTSTSSVLKTSKQKSEKISATSVKDAIMNAAAAKTCKNDVKVADESVLIPAEDRKSKAGIRYEPRIHSVKAIKEWENKSGKRYYDLSPIERKKVNQELSALKTLETKKSSA